MKDIIRATRLTLLVLVLLATAAPLSTVRQASAQALTCDDFTSREAAQRALDRDPDLADTLDEDGNGIACEELPSTGDGESGSGNPSIDDIKLPPDRDGGDETPASSPDDADGDIGTGLGTDRETFETEYGEASSRGDAEDFAIGEAYIGLRGYDFIGVFWDDDIALHIHLHANDPWTVNEALDEADAFLPGDVELDDEAAVLQNGAGTILTGSSAALGGLIPAEVYETYEVGGDPGDLRVIFVGEADAITTVSLAIGRGDEFSVENVETPTEEATEEATEEPDGTETDADADAYLSAVREDVDAKAASIARFYEILDTGANMTDAEFNELIDILTSWLEASELQAPAGLEEIERAYADLNQALLDASLDFTLYLTGGENADPSYAEAAFTELETAQGLIAELDQLLAAEGY